MSSLAEGQDAFRAALFDAESDVPAGLLGRDGAIDAARFAVYRNNVAVSLIEALGARYPVCRRLVGDACFDALAHSFAVTRPPQSPIMLAYGADFADFIAPLPPSRDVPYLADMARLENAWHEVYNEAEATPIELAALPSDALADVCVEFHPALRTLASDWPVASIWLAHQTDSEPTPPQTWHGENVLIARPAADVVLHRVAAGGIALITALRDGNDLGTAAHCAAQIEPNFDAAVALVDLCAMGVLTQIILPVTMETDA